MKALQGDGELLQTVQKGVIESLEPLVWDGVGHEEWFGSVSSLD
jgi:hypothetical protein